jgi:AraC family transcriptional regulator
MPTLSITRQELTRQPVVFVRRQAARHELSNAIGDGLGKTFPFAQKTGLGLAGRPFTRYLSMDPAGFAIEVGIPLSAPAPAEGEIETGFLPGGPAAVALHAGHYDTLSESYAALERWMEANGLQPAGAPWESYVTDPADHADPGDWRTEVYWPVSEAAGSKSAGA